MYTGKREGGQALILIVFAIVGLVGLTGLAIDGGNVYSDHRNAQNAADSAALTGAIEFVHNKSNWSSLAANVAATNGYIPDGTNTTVTVTNPPGADCNGQTWQPPTGSADTNAAHYIQVIIRSTVNTYFAPVVGIRQLHNCVLSIAHAKPSVNGNPFPGSVIVGLAPDGNSYDSGSSNASHWTLTGGGIFANANASSKNSGSVTFITPGACVTAVGTASGFGCTASTGNSGMFIHYPDDVAALLPPIPACDGTATTGAGGVIQPQAGANGSVVDGFDHSFAPGLYCITDAGGNIHSTVSGLGVTFYIQDTSFTMKYNGGGSFAAQAPTSGPYKGVLMFSNITTTPCTQNLDIRGNGSVPIVGTIFMPSACIDWRGNGTGDMTRTELIGYRISSNGNAEVAINYNPNDNYAAALPGAVELTK